MAISGEKTQIAQAIENRPNGYYGATGLKR